MDYSKGLFLCFSLCIAFATIPLFGPHPEINPSLDEGTLGQGPLL